MRITPAELFAPRWSCFWATAYQFEPALFEQFLFRRLGDPPLNVTLLLDANKLAETLEGAIGGDQQRLHRAGRDYVIRPIRMGNGSFHAKTYFFANDHDGILLVGSGNLDLRGLEQGLEVFSRFASTDSDGIETIRSWRDWMQGIVEQLDDDEIHRRWWDLRSRARWIGGAAGPSNFVSTADASMISQLREGLPPNVDELHVLSPFMDKQAAALEELVAATRPKHLHHYIGRNVSVHGPDLQKVLAKLECNVHLWRFEPDRFIHAKLMGVTWGDHGRLISGSANLSRAAFTVSSASQEWANVEVGIISSVSADEVRSIFLPPDLVMRAVTLEDIGHFTYHEASDGETRPYFLRSARWLEDGRVEISVEPDLVTGTGGRLTDGTTHISVAHHQTTGPLEGSERVALVWVEDSDNTPLSNVVPVDDPKALAAWLKDSTGTSDHPKGIETGDLETPIGEMLQRLHRTCIFDIDETAVVSSAQRALEASIGESGDPAFWDKLIQEELELDHRLAGYRHFGSATPSDDDEVLLLLREMLDRTPEHLPPDAGHEAPHGGGKPGHPWMPTQRLQVRLVHVLDRWSRATNDPRLCWLNPAAPVRNYAALLSAVAECWENDYVGHVKLLAVERALFENFLTDGETDGFLLSADAVDRATALQRLPDEARALAAAIVYVALLPTSNWLVNVFDWQPFIVSGIELGVFQALTGCDVAVERLCGLRLAPAAVDDRLLELASYVDDPHWCDRIQRNLDLESVVFDSSKFAAPFKLALGVRGITDPLTDPRLVALLRRAFQYKRAPGIVVTGTGWRLSVAEGQPANVQLPNGAMLESTEVITAAYLSSHDQQRLGFGDIFVQDRESAS